MKRARTRSRRSSLEFQDRIRDRVPVRIGDCCAAGADSLLFTIGLGSCVAIALYDAEVSVGGLAHVMLPERTGSRQREAPPGRFATTAVPELLALMVAQGAEPERMHARLAGGASMFRDVLEEDGLRLGRRNVEASRQALALAGVTITGEDVYGTWGRSVYLRTTDGAVLVTSVNHADILL